MRRRSGDTLATVGQPLPRASWRPAAPFSSVIGGVDTHKHTHYTAVIDSDGRLLGHPEFPAADRGDALLLWVPGSSKPKRWTASLLTTLRPRLRMPLQSFAG